MQEIKRKNISNNDLKKETKSKLEVKLESLTPKDDIDISSYEEALDFALSDDTVTNIAMTGPYGAGKSSVIETYKKKNKDKKFMNISLTHFEGSENTDTNILEGKIVNQLLHQIDYDKIPQTIFKIKTNTKKSKLLGYSASIVLFILSFLITFRFEDWKKYLNHLFINKNSSDVVKKVIDGLSGNVFNIIVLILFLSTSVILLYFFIKLQLNRQLFKKVTFKGNEVEIFKDREESYFDKFMNDVIYLFTSSEKDIIIFEDLDRFENATIYERLYEINLLINKRLLANDSRSQIKFIYLIKDDAFESKDRAKLFDLIIPIVPVINSSNSFEQFIKVFEESGISQEFDKKILQKLSLYIDDMRLLKNISNEYYIYKNRLSQITLDNNKLLATIVYKNIFPKDFSNFQLGLGFINKVFNLKSKLIEEKIKTIEFSLEKINIEINESENEMFVNIDELDSLFFVRPIDGYYLIEGKKESDFINGADFISAIKKNNFEVEKVVPVEKKDYYGRFDGFDYKSSGEKINISEEFDRLNDSKEYQEKLKKINNKNILNKKQLQIKKSDLQSKLNDVSSLEIAKLLDTVDNSFFDNKEIKTDDLVYLYKSPYFELIIFILRESLIDENYTDYLTYFYEHSLSKKDKEFLRGIYDRKPKDWKYGLKNVDRISTELTIEELNRFKILNYDLFIFFMVNHYDYEDELSIMFSNLRRVESIKYILDLYDYFKKENQLILFFNILELHWSNIIEDVIVFNKGNRIEIEELIYTAVYYFSTESVLQNNSGDRVFDFIEESMDFEEHLKNNKISIEKYLEKLNILKIMFSSIDSMLFYSKRIIELNLFEITEENLRQIFFIFNLGNDIDFYQSNATKILGEEILKKNIYEKRLTDYIELYLSFYKDTFIETPEIIKELLNNPFITDDNKIKISENIDKDTKVEKITEISDKGLAKILCDNGNVVIDGYNVFNYFKSNKLTKEIVSNINQNDSLISFEVVIDKHSKEIIESLFEAVIHDEQLNNEQYASMLKSLGFYYKDGFSLDIMEERVGILIENGIISVTYENIRDISATYPEVLYKFVLRDSDKFIELFEVGKTDNEVLLSDLLKNKEIKIIDKKRLIDISKNNVSVLENEFEDEIIEYILNNKFNEEDISELMKKYNVYIKSIKNTIYLQVKNLLSEILLESYEINKELLNRLLDDQEVNESERQKLFEKYIYMINLKELEYYVKRLNLSIDFINVLKGKRPTFEINKFNKSILEEYKERGYINKIREENGMYRISGKRILK